ARAAFQTCDEFRFLPAQAGQGVKDLLTMGRGEAERLDDLDRIIAAARQDSSRHEISPKLTRRTSAQLMAPVLSSESASSIGRTQLRLLGIYIAVGISSFLLRECRRLTTWAV